MSSGLPAVCAAAQASLYCSAILPPPPERPVTSLSLWGQAACLRWAGLGKDRRPTARVRRSSSGRKQSQPRLPLVTHWDGYAGPALRTTLKSCDFYNSAQGPLRHLWMVPSFLLESQRTRQDCTHTEWAFETNTDHPPRGLRLLNLRDKSGWTRHTARQQSA